MIISLSDEWCVLSSAHDYYDMSVPRLMVLGPYLPGITTVSDGLLSCMGDTAQPLTRSLEGSPQQSQTQDLSNTVRLFPQQLNLNSKFGCNCKAPYSSRHTL